MFSREVMEQNKPVVHEIMGLSMYLAWAWKGCGFGEFAVSYDPGTKKWAWDTETMSPKSVRKILHAAADYIADHMDVIQWGCPQCGKDLKLGDVIDPGYPDGAIFIVPPTPLTNETLKVTKCWKCVACGHSVKLDEK